MPCNNAASPVSWRCFNMPKLAVPLANPAVMAPDVGYVASAAFVPRPRLPLVQTIATVDVDEQAALLSGWNQTYNQLSAGRFSGHLTNASVDGFLIFREVTANSLHQIGVLPEDLFAIGVPLYLQGAATFCGQSCNGSQLHIFSGRDGFEFHSPSGLDIVGIVFAKETLLRSFSEGERERLEPNLRRAHLYDSSTSCILRLRTVVAAALAALHQTPDIFASPDLLVAFKKELAGIIADVLTDDLPNEAVFLSSERRLQIVRDVRVTLRDNEVPVTVEDLCRILRISRRTLQYCFQEAIGMKPVQYMRAIRLNGARRELKHGLSVTDAATKWGFWHFGRFAQDYKALFGESPSATKQRHQFG